MTSQLGTSASPSVSDDPGVEDRRLSFRKEDERRLVEVDPLRSRAKSPGVDLALGVFELSVFSASICSSLSSELDPSEPSDSLLTSPIVSSLEPSVSFRFSFRAALLALSPWSQSRTWAASPPWRC